MILPKIFLKIIEKSNKNNEKKMLQWTRISLFCTCLVVLMGTLVRSNNAGMGCPDWPKCFGYYLPPYQKEQLLFQPQHAYKKGQMVLWEERFYKAEQDFFSSNFFVHKNWQLFTEHQYTHYDPIHTYIEYANRLTSVLLGFCCLILTFYAFKTKRKQIIFTQIILLFSLAWQAWLGAQVVASELLPYKITLHLLVALWIVFLIIRLENQALNKPFRFLKGTALILFLVLNLQFLLGTLLREKVDVLRKNEQNINTENLGLLLWTHIAVAVILSLIQWLYIQNSKQKANHKIKPIFIFLGLIISGLFIGNIGLQWAQPIHLCLSVILFIEILRNYKN